MEATKFTEVGYVGRDVDQIVRDLVESALAMVRDKRRAGVRASGRGGRRGAHPGRPDRPRLDRRPATASARSCGPASWTTRKWSCNWPTRLAGGGMFDMPGQPGAGAEPVGNDDSRSARRGGRTKTHKTTVIGAWAPLIAEESDKLLDQEALTQEALELAENHGIVFLDEIDKVASSSQGAGAPTSPERASSATCCR